MEKERNLEIRVKCPVCGNVSKVMVNKEDFNRYRNDATALVQDTFPYLNQSERELLISGTCDYCWEKLFADEEEEL